MLPSSQPFFSLFHMFNIACHTLKLPHAGQSSRITSVNFPECGSRTTVKSTTNSVVVTVNIQECDACTTVESTSAG